jgi:hypothetical protein
MPQFETLKVALVAVKLEDPIHEAVLVGIVEDRTED